MKPILSHHIMCLFFCFSSQDRKKVLKSVFHVFLFQKVKIPLSFHPLCVCVHTGISGDRDAFWEIPTARASRSLNSPWFCLSVLLFSPFSVGPLLFSWYNYFHLLIRSLAPSFWQFWFCFMESLPSLFTGQLVMLIINIFSISSAFLFLLLACPRASVHISCNSCL